MPAYFFRSEPGAVELRRLARSESGRVCQRVLLIASLREGMEHEEAARLAGLSRSAAYTWHNRYEEEGIEGLRDRPRPGRQPRIDAVTSARFKERDCRRRRAGAGRGGGVSRGRRATDLEGGICCRLQPVEHLSAAASDEVELAGAASAPPGGRRHRAGGVFATVGLQLERVRAAQAPGTRVRAVVSRRGSYRPEEQSDPGVGANRQPAGGAQGSRLRLGLPVWRGLPEGGQSGGADHAAHRRDEPSSQRDQQSGRRPPLSRGQALPMPW